MIDYQNYSSSFVNSVQKRDEQTMDSLQPSDQLSQMRRKLQILQWSVAGVIIMMNLLCHWTIRMRRLQKMGRTASTTGTCRDAGQCSVKSARISSVCLPEEQHLFVSQTPLRLRQDKQPEYRRRM